jgi:hypothetical protein
MCAPDRQYVATSDTCVCTYDRIPDANGVCQCTSGRVWDSGSSSCICPGELTWSGTVCECTGGRIESTGNTCVCPSNT